MDATEIYAAHIEKIARIVQDGFLDIRKRIKSGRLSQEQKTAVNSLPHDVITKEAKNRLAKFPNDCCMDAAHVLAIVFIAIAEQRELKHNQLEYIRAIPTDKTRVRMFDFHQGLQVDGFNVDITFGQLRTVQKGNAGRIVFPLHPLFGSDDYAYGIAKATIEDAYSVFANYIITTYFQKQR